jgi:uncharacterized membrane protein YdbT with pleckstrin-like domain
VLLLIAFIGLAVVSRTQAWPEWTMWAFLIAEVIPVLIIAWTFIHVATVQYELTSERIRETTGIISRNLEEIELYRVKDINVKRSPAQLILGAADITLHTSDTTRPTLELRWLPDFREKHETVRTHVERCRLRHRARVVEFEGEDMDGDLM